MSVAVAFGKQRQVVAFDINQKRIAELIQGNDNTREVTKKDLKA